MEQVETDSDMRMGHRLDQHRRRFEIVDERIPGLKFEGDFDLVTFGRLSRLAQWKPPALSMLRPG